MFVDVSAIVAILTREPETDVLADLLNAGIKSMDLVTKLT
jgi:uncharacterized protein with PIN domain